jgi:hypothetical protein
MSWYCGKQVTLNPTNNILETNYLPKREGWKYFLKNKIYSPYHKKEFISLLWLIINLLY